MTGIDRISEEIAHFIGMFDTIIEQSRMREAYDEFTPAPTLPSDPELPEPKLSDFAAPHHLLGFDPGVRYIPPGWRIEDVSPWMPLKHKYFKVPLAGPHLSRDTTGPNYEQLGSNSISLPEIDPPGSVATYLFQGIQLSDNDYFGVGGHGLIFAPHAIGNDELLKFAAEAKGLSPIGDRSVPGNAAELKEMIASLATKLEGWVPDAGGLAEFHVHHGVTLAGTYVNGQLIEESPNIGDYFDLDPDDEEEPLEESAAVKSMQVTYEGHMQMEASVEIDTGSNTAINNAVIKNLWTGGTVTVVAGDHIQLDAIIQINAIYDKDAISQSLNGWTVDDATNEFFNIANFKHNNPLEDDDAQASGSPVFPSYWIVTEITGDLLIVNWIEQYIFQSDNDIGIVSSSGVTTQIIAGNNTGVNHVSLYELAYAYDIIVIGGSWYDANIIQQLNVLYDNDLIGAVEDFETIGTGSLSTQANLLWNEALIYNVSGTHGDMPTHYQELANNLAAGRDILPDIVLSDPALAGNQTLRVLYVEGDLINLNYIAQTSIVGDSDQIALAMSEFTPRADAEWTITTGSNALINNAAIVDLDSLGNVHVGGQQYSQAMLVQAELVSDKPDFWARDPDALVNEAVAFLEDDFHDGMQDIPAAFYTPDNEMPGGDGLQSMLG